MSSSEWQQHRNFITYPHIFLSFRDTPEWEHDDDDDEICLYETFTVLLSAMRKKREQESVNVAHKSLGHK